MIREVWFNEYDKSNMTYDEEKGELVIGTLEDIKNGLSKAKINRGENSCLFYIKTGDDMKELKYGDIKSLKCNINTPLYNYYPEENGKVLISRYNFNDDFWNIFVCYDYMKELKEINSLNEYVIPFFQNNNFVKEGIVKEGQVKFIIDKKYDEVYSDNGINNIFIQNLGIEQVEVISPNLAKHNKALISQFAKNGCEVIVKLGSINKNGKLKRKSRR